MKRLQHKHLVQIVHTIGWTAMCGLIVCLFCFIYTEKLRHNYNDIQSGNTTETCKTVGYDIVQRSYECRIYSIDQCAYGRGRRELTSQGTISCPDPVIEVYMKNTPLGTSSLYYHFNARRNRYYTQDQYDVYVKKYSSNPVTSITVLMIATVLAAVASLAYLYWSFCSTGSNTTCQAVTPTEPKGRYGDTIRPAHRTIAATTDVELPDIYVEIGE